MCRQVESQDTNKIKKLLNIVTKFTVLVIISNVSTWILISLPISYLGVLFGIDNFINTLCNMYCYQIYQKYYQKYP